MQFAGLSAAEKKALEGKNPTQIQACERMGRVSNVMDTFMDQFKLSPDTKTSIQARKNEFIQEHILNAKAPDPSAVTNTISKQLFNELRSENFGGGR